MLEWACTTQVRTLSMGLTLQQADADTVVHTEATLESFGTDFDYICEGLVWPAVLRKLERINSDYRI